MEDNNFWMPKMYITSNCFFEDIEKWIINFPDNAYDSPNFLKVSFKEIIHIQKLKTPLFPIYARSIENHRFKNSSELVY